MSFEIVTIPKLIDGFEVSYIKLEDGSYCCTVVESIAERKKEEPSFSVTLGSEVLISLFKKYLSDEEYRNEIFSKAEGVDDMSLFQVNENFEYVINKVIILAIIKKFHDSPYLVVEDHLLIPAIKRALNELNEDVEIEVDDFLMEEMGKLELVKEQKKNCQKESCIRFQK
ncbi:hypothetical protein TNCV_4301531 [Trichonephila clavipes]|uniref:Uncharacterized protein n=1 Tax=Trichonephila clavipes TaxID=2585209 RepID=A0A8X6RQ83_TRICX|nr:hypothetical protein TNCV_4301531 [Trichonephila clavipes]